MTGCTVLCVICHLTSNGSVFPSTPVYDLIPPKHSPLIPVWYLIAQCVTSNSTSLLSARSALLPARAMTMFGLACLCSSFTQALALSKVSCSNSPDQTNQRPKAEIYQSISLMKVTALAAGVPMEQLHRFTFSFSATLSEGQKRLFTVAAHCT